MRTLRLVLRGRVQGVGFRWFAREAGRQCDLAGWVRNREDGAVEIVASGQPDALDRFVDAVRRGPPGARVDDLEYLAVGEPGPVERPFSVRR